MRSFLRRGAGATKRVAASGSAPPALSAQQVTFFQTFGFLVLRGWFTPDMETIQEGFEEVFAGEEATLLDPDNPYHRTSDPQYSRETRWIIPTFIDKSEKLAWLRTDPRLTAITHALLGRDCLYAESDGNLFNCDVYWHLDAYGAAAKALHIKVFFYLDPLREGAGALRVMPGTQLRGSYLTSLFERLALQPERVQETLGVSLDEIPSWTLEVDPGDVIVTNFRILHGSFNGGVRRRLFTVNFRAAADDVD